MFVFVASVSALPCAAQSSVDEWPTFRGTSGNGRAEVPPGQVASGLGESWKVQVGSGYCGLSVAAGRVVTCAEEGGSDVLLALDASSGRKSWSVRLSEAFVGYGGSLDGAIATPAIADGIVYMLGRRGQFVAVELATGRELWRVDLAALGGEPGYYGYSSSPLVAGKRVLAQAGGELGGVVALERDSGELAWRSFASGIDAQSPMLTRIDGREQIVVATNQWLAGLDPVTGAVSWSLPFETSSGFVTATSPLPVADGMIFYTVDDNRAVLFSPPGGSVARDSPQDAPEPAIVWEGDLLTRTYSPAVVVGDSLIGYTSRFLSAFSLKSGERIWRSRAPGDGFLIGVGDQLLVITKSGSLHLANVKDQDGTAGWNELAALPLFEEIVWTPPSYAGGAVYVRSMTEIARVDLVTEGSEVTVTESDRSASPGNSAIPTRLAALLDGELEELEKRIDSFLQDVETPLLDGTEALFLYRDSADRPATDVGIAGDFLGMRMEGAFQRLADSTLWWYQIDLDPRLQYTYVLYVDYEAQLDPLNPTRERNSVVGRNANWVRGPEAVEMSYFAMPDWSGPPRHLQPGAPTPQRRGRVAEVSRTELPEPLREGLRGLKVWLPPSYDAELETSYPTVYLHGWRGAGDFELSRLIDILDATVGSSFEPLILVFFEGQFPVSSVAPLVETIDAQFRTERRPERRANMSMAWGGYETMILGFREPELFRKFAAQSFLGFEEEVEQTLEAFSPVAPGEEPWVGYLDWGVLDIRSPSEGWDMRRSARRAYETLEERGVKMSGGEVVATTDWKSWRQRTHRVLGALFPPLR